MITSTHSVTNYRADLFPLLASSEGFGKPANRPGLPYFDSVGKATIGYGFNIEDGNVARLVLTRWESWQGRRIVKCCKLKAT